MVHLEQQIELKKKTFSTAAVNARYLFIHIQLVREKEINTLSVKELSDLVGVSRSVA